MKKKELIYSQNIRADFAQVVVFDPTLENPFNDWTKVHTNQGFAWRQGSVSFRLLDEPGEYEAKVYYGDHYQLKENLLRSICVPFEVVNNSIEIGGVIDSEVISIPSGMYDLFFDIYLVTDNIVLFFSFVPERNPYPKILKVDDLLDPPKNLLMKAIPA